MRLPIALLAAPLLAAACSTTPGAHETPAGALDAAAAAVNELRAEQPGLDYFLPRAQAVLIFPSLKEAALVVGVSGGDCVLVERNGDRWGSPRFMSASGISFGVQGGAQGGKVVVAIMNGRLLSNLQQGFVDFGGNVSIALGPADMKAASSAQTFQDAYVFRDAAGAFAGVALNSAVIADDKARNAAFRAGPGGGQSEMDLMHALDVAPEQPGH